MRERSVASTARSARPTGAGARGAVCDLRPSLVYGPGYYSMAFFARLVGLPLTPVPGDGHYLVQPIHVADLARAVTLAVERDDLAAATIDAGRRGADVRRDARCAGAAAGQGGGAKAAHSVAADDDRRRDYGCDRRGPITSEELGMLRREIMPISRRLCRRSGSGHGDSVVSRES